MTIPIHIEQVDQTSQGGPAATLSPAPVGDSAGHGAADLRSMIYPDWAYPCTHDRRDLDYEDAAARALGGWR